MKKMLLIIVLTIYLLSGCIITNNFDAYHRLALKAISQGAKESTKEYARLLSEISETNQQKSIALMVSGYGNFLSDKYGDALIDFSASNEYQKNDESVVGTILSNFMLNQYEMINFQIDELDTISNNWLMIVNFEELTKLKIYEISALSNAILKNKIAFDTFKSKLEQETSQKMEAFFFE